MGRRRALLQGALAWALLGCTSLAWAAGPLVSHDGVDKALLEFSTAGLDPTAKALLGSLGQSGPMMDRLRHLTEHIGPRLSGSPADHAAHAWAEAQFKGMGLRVWQEHVPLSRTWKRGAAPPAPGRKIARSATTRPPTKRRGVTPWRRISTSRPRGATRSWAGTLPATTLTTAISAWPLLALSP